MIRLSHRRSRAVVLLALAALLLTGGATAGRAANPPAAAGPTLTDVSAATQTPALFTVAGADFTPGGRVYLAVYDQMGAKLYETRWVSAGAAAEEKLGMHGELVVPASPGGTLRAAFAGLCGASAMMRAYDQTARTWSNWLDVEPGCGAADAGRAPGRR